MRRSHHLGILAIGLLLLSLTAFAPKQAVGADQEPAYGMALEAAIDHLVTSNYRLRTQFQEIPQARADELTASLRNAPAIFVDGNQLPYGSYSERRPGVATYEVSPALNVDYSGKRRSHMRQTRFATRQVEALYQNAVREEIDHLYDAYVDVLQNHEMVRMSHANLASLTEIAGEAQKRIRQGKPAELEMTDLSVQQFKATSAVGDAEMQQLEANRKLADLLALPANGADGLQVHGSLHDRSASPPSAKELLCLALESRPDLMAERLGVEYDRATMQVVQAERFDDAIVFYAPFQADNNRPQGKQVSTSWGAGAGTTMPLLDRSQGNIRRARIILTQRQIELQGLERRIANEVQRAQTEYEASREVVRHYEQDGLPAITRLRDESHRRFAAGEEALASLLDSQKNYHEESRRYLEALGRHRRAMLKLNTIVGQRILP
ncbi:MAG TPA: TolC family protein [Gemmataceae bacterium]|nr:TolC family protein [Gemmataceae bacterium]